MVVESMREAARARLFVIADDPRMIDAPSLLLGARRGLSSAWRASAPDERPLRHEITLVGTA